MRTPEEKKQKRLIILGLGLTFTLIVLAASWLWIERSASLHGSTVQSISTTPHT